MLKSFISNGSFSSENYKSNEQAFFSNDSTNDIEIEKSLQLNIPDYFPETLKQFYSEIGNPSVEFYKDSKTYMSLNHTIDCYKDLCNNNQTNVLWFCYEYAGMGHIKCFAYDLSNGMIFYYGGGGSNGWDRELNYKKIIEYKPSSETNYIESSKFFSN